MFAQSAIELAALWLNEGFNLGLIRNNIAFHRKEYQRAAAARIQGFDAFFDRHAVAISRIRDYRVGWFHHASGGAAPYSDRAPDHSVPRGFYGVPIDPSITGFSDPKVRIAKIEACKARHGGEWLYKLHDFAELIYPSAEEIVLDAIALAVQDA